MRVSKRGAARLLATLVATALSAPGLAGADDESAGDAIELRLESRARYRLMDDGALHIDVAHADAYRPHGWLGKTVKTLDLELAEPDMALGFAFDVQSRSAQIQLGDAGLTGFGLHTRVHFQNGGATIFATLAVGQSLSLRLPEVTIVPRSQKGQRYLEYQVPVVRGNIDDLFTSFRDPRRLLDRLKFF